MARVNNKDFEIYVGCRSCHRGYSVWVNEEDFWDWENGELTQVAFPYLSTAERELLITHTCEVCQRDWLPKEEEDEEVPLELEPDEDGLIEIDMSLFD